MMKNIAQSSKVPVNIITGFLGVGKTTTIQHIIKHKPKHERWALIINEFGAISIDHTAFANTNTDELTVKEIAGGCICCSANLPMQMTLTLVLRQIKPHRILIEPTGLGHPASILDMLRGKFLKDILAIRATVCLIDPRQWEQEKYQTHETYIDQITLADVLIANKTDLAGEQKTAAFIDWATKLFPPKMKVVAIKYGEIDIRWLDLKPFDNEQNIVSDAHVHHHHAVANTMATDSIRTPQVGEPLMYENHGLGSYSCGWVFSPDEVFDLAKLKQWIGSLQHIERVKGAFRTGIDWVLINAVQGEFTVAYLAYRRDSRVECIAMQPLAWQTLQNQLEACLLKTPQLT